MKKSVMTLIVFAALLISGCSSVENEGVSLTAANPGFDSAAAESGIAAPSIEFEPPLLQLELNTADASSRLNLTAGSFKWDENGVSTSSHADPISLADGTSDVAVVNTSAMTGNPRLLTDGGRIVSAVCRRDSANFLPCEIVNDEIVLCHDSAYDIYSVTVDYDCGSCEYVFKTVAPAPPVLRIRVGNTYHALSQNNYEWEAQIGDETAAAIACGPTPWECRGSCPAIDLSGETKAVLMLPDDAEIAGIYVYSDEDVYETPEFNGRTFDLPADPNNKLYHIDVVFPGGRCEYVFSTFVDGAPTSSDMADSREICGYPLYTETEQAVPAETSETASSTPAQSTQQTPSSEPSAALLARSTQLAQSTQSTQPIRTDNYTPATYSWRGSHHNESHHGHHGRCWQQSANNCISDCRLDNLSFYAYGYDISAEQNHKRDYEGAITDKEVIAELWDIITKQELQPEVSGNESYTGFPYIKITDNSTGNVYTVSFSTMITYGSCHGLCPDVVGHVCDIPATYTDCMRISGGIYSHHAVIDGDAARFNELVMNSLKQYEPVNDAVFSKSAKTDRIVFVQRYTNYAWASTDEGYFIDCYGNKYVFDFGGKRLDENSEEFFNELWQVYLDNDPVERGLYDEKKLFDILVDDIQTIDENAEVSEDPRGADMGQLTLYVVDIDGHLIKLRSEGDVSRQLEDETAKKLCDFFDNEKLS